MSTTESVEDPIGIRRIADPGGIVGGSRGSGSAARGFPHVQGPATGVRQAQADGGSRPGSGAAEDVTVNLCGTDAAPGRWSGGLPD